MSALRINVTKEKDGFTFSILPSVSTFISSMFPGSHPATSLFINYGAANGFDILQTGIEKYVYQALSGVDKDQLKRQIDKIEFINTESGKVQKVISL